MKKLFIAAILYIGAAGAAFALDFTQEILTFDGKSFTDAEGKPVPQVLGTIVENSLLSPQQSDTEDAKNKRFWLALKIHEHAKDYAPTPDEIVMIKKALAAIQSLAIMGQATRLIDPTYVK